MPFVTNGAARIHYQVEGDGPPLVLAHGLTQCTEDWRIDGYVAALAPQYRLVLIDARGCGRSTGSDDPAFYAPELTAGDVVAVLDDLGVDRAHYLGYSMGGVAGLTCVARFAPTRFASFVFGGAPSQLAEGAPAAFMATIVAMVERAAEQGMAEYVAGIEAILGQPMPPARKELMLRLDPHAAYARARAVQAWPSAADVLPTIAVPSLFYAGDQDPFHDDARDAAGRTPGARFASLPGLDHRAAYFQSGPALAVVVPFLASVAPTA